MHVPPSFHIPQSISFLVYAFQPPFPSWVANISIPISPSSSYGTEQGQVTSFPSMNERTNEGGNDLIAPPLHYTTYHASQNTLAISHITYFANDQRGKKKETTKKKKDEQILLPHPCFVIHRPSVQPASLGTK